MKRKLVLHQSLAEPLPGRLPPPEGEGDSRQRHGSAARPGKELSVPPPCASRGTREDLRVLGWPGPECVRTFSGGGDGPSSGVGGAAKMGKLLVLDLA